MPSITVMMSLILRLASLISAMLATTCETMCSPRCAAVAAPEANWLAWRAASALWRTVPVSSSIELAVCCRFEAVCSVRTDRSWLPVAISEEAVEIESVAWRITAMVSRRRCVMVTSEPRSDFSSPA
jgi:hypothetical protein